MIRLNLSYTNNSFVCIVIQTFQLTHIFSHLMNEGIGLRQLVDYYYVLISDDLSLIRDRVQKELKELGLWKFAGGIMYIMQEVFGMPASRLIASPNEKYGKFVLNEVLEAEISEGMMPGIGLVGHSLDIISKGCIGI